MSKIIALFGVRRSTHWDRVAPLEADREQVTRSGRWAARYSSFFRYMYSATDGSGGMYLRHVDSLFASSR